MKPFCVLRHAFLAISCLIAMGSSSLSVNAWAQINVPVGSIPIAVAVNPVTNKVYVANSGGNTVTVIDGTTNNTSTVTAGTSASAVAVNPVTNKVYVANFDGSVSVIDGSNDTVSGSPVVVGGGPIAVAVNPLTNKIYVANFILGTDTVTVIDGATNVPTPVTVGAQPVAMAVNPVTNKVYVANFSGNSVTVIDGASNHVEDTLTVGTRPYAVAVNPVTNKVYVANLNGNSVTVIDGASNSVRETLIVGNQPNAVAVNPVTNKVYVSNNASNSVTVIDGTNDTISGSPVMVGAGPNAVAVNSVTDKVFVTNSNGNSVTVIDGATSNTGTVTVGTSPGPVAVNPVTNRVYAANLRSNNVTVIDGAINAMSFVPTGVFPSNAVAVNPVTNKVYIPNGGSATPGNTVTVLDVATNNVIDTVTVGSVPAYAVVNPVTNKVYVANAVDGTVSVIDSATDTVLSTVTVGSFPLHLSVNPVTNKVYVPNFGGTTVSVIDGASDTVIASPTVGAGPSYAGVNSATNKVYVTSGGSATVTGNTISVIDGTSNNVLSTVTVGSTPGWVSVNPVTNKIYVANSGIFNTAPGNTVSVIDGETDTVIATPTTGTFPRQIAVNTATNKIYVSNSASSDVTFIDGVTNDSTQIDTSAAGTFSYGVGVNPVTNSVYVTKNIISPAVSPGLVVLDGASNSITAAVLDRTIRGPQDVVVYPAANKVYFLNLQSNDVSVIDVDGHQTVPLTTTVAGVVDSLTISTTNVFQTANHAPSFTVDVTSAFTGVNRATTNPPPTGAYYEVDGGTRLSADAKTNGSVANPGSFNITLGPQQIGLHTLYVYAAYGNEGGHNSSGHGTGNSPEMGNLTAYLFLVVPVSTTTTLTTDVNPQAQGQPVIFTAQVAPPAPTGGPSPTGTVTFYEGTTVLGSGSIDSNGFATFTASSLSLGDHSITAAYSGDPNYGASKSSPLSVTIVSSLNPTIELVGGNDQAAVYGNAFAQPLTVVVTQPGGTPMAGVTVTFAGANLSFSPSGTVTTNSSGQASVMATGAHIGDLLAIATTPGVSSAANFALTVTPAPLTVTANNVSRTFGAANPALTGTITGAVHGDRFTFSASTIATQSSPVGTYPINPSVTGAALANYTVHTVNGTLTVTKATLTVTASDAKRLFGQPNPLLTTTITGFVNGDSSAVLSGAAAVSTTASMASPAGAYPITVTQGTLSATNYGFAFVNGTLLVEVVILTPPAGPTEEGTPVTLTATVPVGATGTVTFYEGTTPIGTVTVPSGIRSDTGIPVTLVTTSLAPGTQTITAVFSGDANFPRSTSPPITVVVTPPPPDFTLASSTGRQLIPPGASANFTIAVSSVNGPFTNSVTMSAMNLPPGATYTFTPAAVTPGAAGANPTFTVSVPKQSSMASRSRSLGPIAFALMLLPFARLKRYHGKPPQRFLLWILAALVSLGAVSGCGEGGYFSQTEQTYTITITGTSGSLVRSTTVTLTVE